jgi:hypothetical protein
LSYRAEISRASPTAIVMVMDQSASMNHRLKSGQSKAAFLADVLNKTLYTVITSCSKASATTFTWGWSPMAGRRHCTPSRA